jgi:glucose/arabinose dehydrogenase
VNKTVLSGALAFAFAALLSGCNEHASYDSAHQASANAPLPAARSFLTPSMQVPKHVGWREGGEPKVADGLKIEKIASGLEHPRQVYGLPKRAFQKDPKGAVNLIGKL